MPIKLDPLSPVVGYDVVFYGEERHGRDESGELVAIRQPTPRRERLDSCNAVMLAVERMLRRDGAGQITIEVVRR